MPVTAPGRQSRHAGASRNAGTKRTAALRKAAARPPAALTVTFNIPLTGDGLPPQARRLLEAVRELVEAGEGSIQVASDVKVAGDVGAASGVGAGGGVTGPDVRLSCASRQVHIDGEHLPLTRLEFDLLKYLADHPHRVFSRAQLLTAVWGYEHTGERTVDVHVRRLRVKMHHVPLITTVYGVGYRLADDARVTIAQ
jgi:two-component system, OmpR family, response regulator